MRYKNARDIFPKEVLAFIQQYADGEYIYIPRKDENRKSWGDNTPIKKETHLRNKAIFSKYCMGYKVTELALEYYLSEKSIERIITLGRKEKI